MANFWQDNLPYNSPLLQPGLHWPNVISSASDAPNTLKSLLDLFSFQAGPLPCLLLRSDMTDIGYPASFSSVPQLKSNDDDNIDPEAWKLVQDILSTSYEDYVSEDSSGEFSKKIETPVDNSKMVKSFLKLPSFGTTLSNSVGLPPKSRLMESSKLVEQSANKQYKFAINVACRERLSEAEFRRRVPHPVHEFPFQLDAFQQQAISCVEAHQSVLVAAHTSAGKTVVAEYAIRLCLSRGTRVIYTSPIKALSNQKYRDFKETFDDVGLITGDIQISPNAKCLIMTTEILRSMLYSVSTALKDLDWVIFDEVHYINDPERGVVWEEVLILLPQNVGIILLSATVSNSMDFAEWIGHIKQRPVYVVSTAKRPVPLQHFLYTGTSRKDHDQLFLLVDKDNKFLMDGYSKASDRIHGVVPVTTVNPSKPGPIQQQDKQDKLKKGTFKHGGKQNTPGHSQGGGASGSGGGGASAAQRREETQWLAVVDLLRQQDKLPAVVFLFSKRRINQLVTKLRTVELLNKTEQHRVKVLTNHWIALLKPEDRELPQIIFMMDLLHRGLACHHSGILPLLKEMVELLFQLGLVKLLFATETFAMGVNMPARTVVFDSLQKHDGTQMRYLLPSEYTQMAGRAGRRGLDATGTVILVLKPDPVSLPTAMEIQRVMLGRSAELESRFRLTYTMLLNLHRTQGSKVEDMMRFSFVQAGNLRTAQAKEQRLFLLKQQQQQQSNLSIDCEICSFERVQSVYNVVQEWVQSHKCCMLGIQETTVVTSTTPLLAPKVVPSPCLQSHTLDTGRPILFCSYASQRRPGLGCVPRLGLWLKPGRNVQSHWVLTYSSDVTSVLPPDTSTTVKSEEPGAIGMILTVLLGGVAMPQEMSMAELLEVSADKVCLLFSRRQCGRDFSLTRMQAEEIMEDFRRRQMERFHTTAVTEVTEVTFQNLTELMKEIAQEANVTNSVCPAQCLSRLTEANWTTEAVPSLQKDSEILPKLVEWSRRTTSVLELCRGPEMCPAMYSHVLVRHQNYLRQEEMSQLQQLLAERVMLPEYEAKLRVLQNLDYLGNKLTLKLKGVIACELGLHELIITELLLQTEVRHLKPSEFAALFSCFVYEKNASADASQEDLMKGLSTEGLRVAVREVNRIETQVAQVERNSGVSQANSATAQPLNFGLCPQVHAWAEGRTFAEVMQLGAKLHQTGTSGGTSPWPEPEEGVLVRCVQRLDELLRHVRTATKTMGNPELEELATNASLAIRRDVIFAQSLYTLVESSNKEGDAP